MLIAKLSTLLTSLVFVSFVSADDPETSPGAPKTPAPAPSTGAVLDPNSIVTKYEYLGEVTGIASKIDKGIIHLKVPALVPANNTNRNRNTNYNRNSQYHSNSAIRRPAVTTKLIDQHYTLSDNAVVKSINGKEGSLSDVKSGETIRIHIIKVLVGKPGERMEHHFEVKSIDVASVAVAGSGSGSTTAKK
jgi:hypothetical protein